MSSQSSARYEGFSPRSDLKTNIASLKTIRRCTGNQCKRGRTGEMWSRRLVCQKSHRRVLDRLQTPKQVVRDTVKQRVAVIEPTEYKRLD